MVEEGYEVFDSDAAVARWARAALRIARVIAADPAQRAQHLRHGKTWFVGVDALPNAADGAIEGVPLTGPWERRVDRPASWHAAQLSIVYPGYPARDPDQSEANHRFRVTRFAAHVDGLLPVGPDRRRYLREPHAFVLGLPLNLAEVAPLMVWPGSQRIMGAAFRAVIGEREPTKVDLTEAYQAARREVFDSIAPMPVAARPGQAILLHRHLLHGMAPWPAHTPGPAEGRMLAYFRPQFSAEAWVADT
ncbi:hypothetical protein AB2B41_17480 [Marimonas sp. MJW-29]|uniref:Phytanoyl-CoA dioxygenase (PhyH) n=1 Tax=Sulfitobacter sediminis TaxID=3234186 RepID=A0ABV3RTN9_9RHOB